MCNGQNIYENNRRAADYVDRIFRGAKPSELPTETAGAVGAGRQPPRAQAIGLGLPNSILLRADRVID